MKKLLAVLMVGLLALAFLPASHAFAQGKVVRITLIDENGSGEDGSAQLTDQGDGTTKVELLMLNAPEGAEQPAHIHKGTCTTLDPKPAYPLETIKEGKSTTIVKVTLADLAKEKYAINVHKSAAEASVYVSCGNLPSGAAATGGPMTMAQVMTTLLDQANELLGTIKKEETDASKNAYDLYHATFAAHEGEIMAISADTQAKLEDAMRAVNAALGEGNFEEAEQAAEKLIETLTEAQGTLSAGTTTGAAPMSLNDAVVKMQQETADLVAETKNNDKDGSQRAYDDFHTTFAANEEALKAKNPEAQAHIETAMHEVRDALAAGDLGKAATAAAELQKEVNDAATELGIAGASNTGTVAGSMADIFGQLEASAGDLVRETTNKDKDGSQRAYDAYHGVFAANEAAIKEKDAATQADLEERMHEVRDALAASDWDKATAASKELLDAVQKGDAKIASMTSSGTNGGGGDLPTTGNPDSSITLALVALALGLAGVGLLVRGRAIRR